MYPLLRRLSKEGYLTSYLKESSEGPPRKYYKLTDDGRSFLYELLEAWKQFSNGVNKIIKEGVASE